MFQLENDPEQEYVDKIASYFGIYKVGFIWTDLQTEKNSGKLTSHRKDIIVTSNEIIRMAKMQNKYPSICKQSLSGYCGSKFVNVLVNADKQGQIEINSFQVSDQCMSLVKDGIVTNSKETTLMRVRSSKNNDKYIPDIMFIAKNEYGLDVLQKATPTFPLDFFIIRLRNSAPKKPNPLFKFIKFPIEHRITSAPSLTQVKKQIDSFPPVINALSDFHLLLYLATSNVLKLEDIQVIATAIVKKEDSSTLKTIIGNLLKQVPLPPAVTPTTTTTTTPNKPAAASSTSTTPTSTVTPQQQALEQQLTSMGYTPTQAREALWATGYKGIEQAIDFLLSNM